MNFTKSLLSPFRHLMYVHALRSSWIATRPFLPVNLRNIIEDTALSIMMSDGDCIERLKETLEAHMKVLTIEITNICNANCTFCAYRYQERAKGIMSNDLFKHCIGEFKAYGGGVLNLTPVVGDPLIDKDIVKKIGLAKESRAIDYIFLYTNLIGLEKFSVTDILTSGVDEINVSACIGNREMYNHIFGVDRYTTVLRNLESLLEQNQLLGNPVKVTVHIKASRPYSRIVLSADYRRISRYRSGITHIDDAYDNWTGLINKKDIPRKSTFKQVRGMSEPCCELYNGIVVFPDGSVGICWRRDLEGTLLIGNICEDSMEAIWKGRKLQAIRDNWLKGEMPIICRECSCYTPLSHFLARDKMAILNSGRKRNMLA